MYVPNVSENLALTHLLPVPEGYDIGFDVPLITSEYPVDGAVPDAETTSSI